MWQHSARLTFRGAIPSSIFEQFLVVNVAALPRGDRFWPPEPRSGRGKGDVHVGRLAFGEPTESFLPVGSKLDKGRNVSSAGVNMSKQVASLPVSPSITIVGRVPLCWTLSPSLSCRCTIVGSIVTDVCCRVVVGRRYYAQG